MTSREIFVSIMLGPETLPVGRLWFHQRKGRESASFEYEESWLAHSERFALEPALQLTQGQFHTQDGQSLFGAIGDSAPDRWGRVLMRRAASQRAQNAGEPLRTLSELDFLLGVNDETRQGALRFSEKPGGPYLAKKDKASIPPLVELPRLLSATERFLEEEESAQDLKLLLAPGSSLGGARPKASVRDQDGQLSIAKFPRKDDDHNIVIWEAVALTLAQQAGIQVPAWRLEQIAGKPVLLIRRFDREQETRIPFLSAMSMLGAKDNEQHSYLEMAYALAQYGAAPAQDMAALWRRIVFTVLISNTDDHLRNHGFVYERHKGWRLSPAYDLNPTPLSLKPRILSTAIDLDDPTASLETALSVIKEFRLSKDDANNIVRDVAAAVQNWRDVARRLGLNAREIETMASAFEHEDARKAGAV